MSFKIYLRDVLVWMDKGQMAQIHVDGCPTIMFAMIGVDSTEEILNMVRRHTGSQYLEVYMLRGLSGQYQGLEIWCGSK